MDTVDPPVPASRTAASSDSFSLGDLKFERLADEGNAQRLLRLSAALADVTSLKAAADAGLAAGLELLGATAGGIYLVDESTGAQLLVAARGFPDEVVAAFGAIPPDAPVPTADAVRIQEPVILRSPEAMQERYPHLAEVWAQMGTRAIVVLPLVVAGHAIGTLGYAFANPRALPAAELAFGVAVAQQASQALERARLFDAERAARLEAESANLGKMRFLAMLSHELRTPLNAIAGYAQILELGVRGPVTPAQQEDLRRIQQSQAHLVALLDAVLDYARVEAGHVTYGLSVVAVEDAVRLMEALVAPQLQAKGLVYHCKPSPARLAMRADPTKLRQILVNLLTNAIKFTPAGGQITVSSAALQTSAGDFVTIRVEDTGVGIASTQLARVFEPFVQVGEFSGARDGVGLGLAISRDLARGMGGDLTVKSEIGAGSTFTLTLPAA